MKLPLDVTRRAGLRRLGMVVSCLALARVGAAQATSAPPAAGDRMRPLRPILECVAERGPGAYTAYFGFANGSAETVALAAGSANFIRPGADGRGQPTAFAPGRSPRYPRSAFHVDFDGSELAWTLVGPDGRARTATASASSRRCGPAADTGAPHLAIVAPRERAYVATRNPRLRLTYDDDGAVDRRSLRVLVDGVDRTAWFSVGPQEALAPLEGDRALADGAHRIEATISDDAGHVASASRTFVVDTARPRLTVLEPAAGTVSAAVVDVSGRVDDTSPVRVTVGGTDAVVSGGTFRADGVPLGAGPDVVLSVAARDAAGNTATRTISLRVDSRRPVVAFTSPRPGARVRGPVVHVTGTVRGAPTASVTVNGRIAVVEGDAFSVDVPAPEGALVLEAVAQGASGATAAQTLAVTVDSSSAELTITEPASGLVTREALLRVSGRVDSSVSAVEVGGVRATLDGGTFSAFVPLPAAGARTIQVVAQDVSGGRHTTDVDVGVDRRPPALRLVSPGRGQTVTSRTVSVLGTVHDESAVTVTLNGVKADRIGGAWRAELSGLEAGPQTLVAVARDEAGNETRVEQSVTVTPSSGPVALEAEGGTLARGVAGRAALAGQGTMVHGATGRSAPMTALSMAAQSLAGESAAGTGAVVGQVLSDETGLPIAGADVLLTPGDRTATTDGSGRYVFSSLLGPVVISIEKDGMTGVERLVTVEAGAGVVVVDARLRRLADPVTIDGGGGTLAAAFPHRLRPPDAAPSTPPSDTVLTVTVPAGSLTEAGAFRLSALSPQGLPALLPMGYSPIVAFDLRASQTPSAAAVHVTGLPALVLHLVQYDSTQHAWTVAVVSLEPTVGVLDFALPGLGAWALVTVDAMEPPLPAPSPGATLAEAPVHPIPETARSRNFADPASLAAADSSSRIRVVVDSPDALPSGTLVQAEVTETFTLATGSVASEPARLEDILLYRADLDGLETPESAAMALGAELPVVASRQFQPAEVTEGHVHFEILAGREAARSGGSEAVTLTSGGATLSVPAAALAEDTVITFDRIPAPSAFVPRPLGFSARAEVVLDLSGAVLGLPATLEVPSAGAPPGGSFFVARVESVGGETRLRVVAWAERDGERIVTRAHPLLPGLGIVKGGRYVVYHAAPALGFLAGTTRAAGQPVPALVTTSRLPFIGLSGTDGAYVVLTQSGPVRASARVLGTPLIGTADADVASGGVAATDIGLAQAVTTTTVTPADGASAVSVGAQIEIEATAPLDPTSVPASTLHLRKLGDPDFRPVRTVLSVDGRRLAVIPQATLVAAATYTFEAASLKDTFGNAVAVPAVTFTTRDEASAPWNLDALVFSYPVNGSVTMTAPAGALPAGTQILVLNSTSGAILTYSVGDLAISAPLAASIDDRLLMTVTDPQGHSTTIERTEYVAPDGRTAVGTAGGKVRGPDGSELRLPAGATDGTVTLKLSAFPESELPAGQRPELPDAHFGAGLRIDSADKPTFKKEVDLVFPKPAAAPPGAFYYVYRRIQLPGGRVSFETIDQAFLDGGKVITASPPFSGYINSIGVVGGGQFGFAVDAVATSYAILMWTFDELMPGRAASGVITGKVLRASYDPSTGDSRYDPIPGTLVTGVNGAGYSLLEDPASQNVSSSFTQSDGTFTLFDARYTGGLIGVSARTPDGQTKVATAFEGNPMDAANYNLRFFRNIAQVTITFEPMTPAPGPTAVDVEVVRKGADGARQATDGLIVEGSRLLAGIRKKNAVVEQVQIGGQAVPFGSDPLPVGDPGRYDVVTTEDFVASPPGTYRVEVSARGEDDVVRTVVRSFRVVAEGTGNDTPDTDARPVVLEAQTFPKPGSTHSTVAVLPQIEFSEPVRNLAGHVRLFERDESGTETPVTVRLLGVTPGSATVSDVSSPGQAATPVLSLMVEPMPGLRYGRSYRLELTEDIVDLDDPLMSLSKPLVPYTLEFSISALPDATTSGSFPSPGVVVQDGWAYLVENRMLYGNLKVFDVRIPSQPEPVPSADRRIVNRPVDLVARPGRVIVGTSVTNRSVPSNIHVFDVSQPDDPRWVGAASLSNGVLDGHLTRLRLHGSSLYALLYRKGVQVVDLRRAEANFAATGGPGTAAFTQMLMAMSTDGQGFGLDAVVATIPLQVSGQPAAEVPYWRPLDIDVGDYVLSGRMQPVVFVAADNSRDQKCSLYVGSTLGASMRAKVDLVTPSGLRLCPVRVALGRVGAREVAVLGVTVGTVAYGGDGEGVALYDVSNPLQPQFLSFTRLGSLTDISDIAIDGDLALVASLQGGTELVNIADPLQPYSAGRIDGLSGRLAVGEGGHYMSTGGSYSDAPEGGLHTADLDPQCDLLTLRDDRVQLETVRDPDDGSFCGGTGVIVFNVCQASRVTLRIDGSVATLGLDGQSPQSLADVTLAPGTHVVTVPFGTIGIGLDAVKPFTVSARSLVDAERTSERQGTLANELLNRPILPVGRTFVKGVDVLDGHLVRQSTDVKIQGRHLGLEVTRTYSSAARAEDGVMGAGWGWNYSAAVTPMSCGKVNVSTADGTSQLFKTADGGNTFTPQRGYHTSLNKLTDGTYEFVDKGGTRHYFREPVDSAQPEGARRLDQVVEPHGDRLEVTYDLRGRVSAVREVLRGERPVRTLSVRYRRVYSHDRVASVESSLGHAVEYDYDAKGNLTSVKRSGQNVDGGPDAEPTEETYEYDLTRLWDPHQMTAAVAPGGERTEYAYYARGALPGQPELFTFVTSEEELVKTVKEFANQGPAPQPETVFAYDFSQTIAGQFIGTVTDARGNPTTYVLNRRGNPLAIREPLGKETQMAWDAQDILKTSETDAEGRLTEYAYEDGRGNLTKETIKKDGAVLAETVYAYAPVFNKLTYKKDAELRETTYRLTAQGDVDLVTDPEGNRTENHYDAEGRLDWTKDPRGFTTRFREFNDYGTARVVENALQQVTTSTYDTRNRLTEQRQDPYGRVTRVTYDGLDRPVVQERLAGLTEADERVATEYYPSGQPRAVTSALGGRTEYAIDGMDRVVGTSIQVGTQTLTTSAEYDGNGNKVSETDRRGVTRTHVYDALNRLRETRIASGLSGEGPTGVIGTYDYDKVGNKLFETNEAGQRTDFEYDGLYHLETRLLPESMPSGFSPSGRLKEQYVYDRVGNLRSSTDPNGHQTQTEYDGLNRPKRIVDAVGREKQIRYDDPEGSHVYKSRETDLPRGLATSYAYDPLGRETLRTVRMEGEDGDPTTGIVSYPTATQYVDDEHALLVTDARETVTRVELDGLDREVRRVVDVGGLNLETRTAYDGGGNKTSVFDPRNNESRWSYDVLGRLVAATDAQLKTASFAYDGAGLKLSETDRRNVTTVHTYDNLGRPRTSRLLSSPFSGVGWTHETTYRDQMSPRQRVDTDANSHATTFDLDGLGRVVKEADVNGDFVQTTWDGVNRRLMRDKRANVTRFDYDDANRLVKVTDPAPFQAQTLETIYADALNRTTEKDRRGTLKVTQMDPLGRSVRVTRDGVVLETNAYDALGNKVLATDGEDRKTQFVYDKANRLSVQTDGFDTGDAATTQYRYDQNGNRTKVIDPRSTEAAPSQELSYDELNRVTDEWDGARDNTHYAYDEEGHRTSVRAPKEQEAAYLYDELGKLLSVTQPAPASGEPRPVTAHAYDANRNRIRQTDANNHAVRLDYDDLNRLRFLRQDPDGLNLTTEHRYDPNGNETTLVDPKTQTVTNVYDELNRLKTRTYAAVPSEVAGQWRHTTAIGYTYDANGNVAEVQDSVASGTDPPVTLTTTRVYDPLDRLTSETTPLTASLPPGPSDNRTVGYTYFNNGVRKTVTDPSGSVTQYTYDGQNRLQTATTAFGTPQAAATSYTYWPDDLLHTVTYPNGVVATNTYDAADRVASIVNAKDATTISSYAYGYDANSNRTSQVEVNGGLSETTTYGYDDLDRLKTITYPVDTSHPAGHLVTYAYDAVGNRTGETEKDSADTVLADKHGVFDSVNRLTVLNDLVTPAASTSFTWDPNGNQLSKTTSGTTTTYRYDVRDELIEALQGTSISGRFVYDFSGRRSQKIGADGIVQYTYDQTSVLTESDEAGVQKAKYDYGSDRLLSLVRTDEGRRFYSLDGLRSVTNLTNDSGAVVASYHLDAWGNFRFPAELSASRNRFAFTGYEWDPELGLFNAKARYFDPQIGRFLTQDSFLGEIGAPPSLHRYMYAWDRPTFWTDPLGHAPGDWYDARSYDWGTFGKEFGSRALDTTLNVVSVGGYGGLKRGLQSGTVNANDSFSGVKAYAEGVFNTITLGGGEKAVDAYAEGKSAGGVAVAGGKAIGETLLPIEEVRTLADSKKSGWEKAEAIATGVTKIASLAAGGLSLKNALTQGSKATVAVEAADAAEATKLVPAEGIGKPVPPETPLYHYSNEKGLAGINKSRKILASDAENPWGVNKYGFSEDGQFNPRLGTGTRSETPNISLTDVGPEQMTTKLANDIGIRSTAGVVKTTAGQIQGQGIPLYRSPHHPNVINAVADAVNLPPRPTGAAAAAALIGSVNQQNDRAAEKREQEQR